LFGKDSVADKIFNVDPNKGTGPLSFLGGSGGGSGGGGGLFGGGLGSLAKLGVAGLAGKKLYDLAFDEAKNAKGVPQTPITSMDASGRYNIEAEIARRMGQATPNPVEYGLLPQGTIPQMSGGMAEGGAVYPNKGLEALAREAPEVVKRMGYMNGGPVMPMAKLGEAPTMLRNFLDTGTLVGAEKEEEYLNQRPDLKNLLQQLIMMRNNIQSGNPANEELGRAYDAGLQQAQGLGLKQLAYGLDNTAARNLFKNPFKNNVQESDRMMAAEAAPKLLGMDNGRPIYERMNPSNPPMMAAGGPVMPMAYAEGGNVAVQDFERMNGQINGAGTETSDDVPAMLSDGEFVMTGKAVRGAGAYQMNNDSGIITLTPTGAEDRDRGTNLMYEMMGLFESSIA